MKEKIEELEEKIEKIKEDLEQLKQSKQEWKPKQGEEYCLVDLDLMTVTGSIWNNSDGDNIRWGYKVVFKTEEEAEEWLKYLVAKEKAMNVFSEEEWKNGNISKYHIYYNNIKKIFFIDTNNFVQYFNIPYFRTRESAEEFIDKYKEQIKRDMEICS